MDLNRSKIEDLHTDLSDPDTRTRAADILRILIDRIDIKTDENGTIAELTGDIINLITLPEGSDVPVLFESSVKMVAGARNRLDLLLVARAYRGVNLTLSGDQNPSRLPAR